MSYFLSEEDIKNICYEYAKAHLTYDEPIPSFGTKYADKLETALASPQKIISGKLIYPGLPEQTAVLFYEMIKLHPFMNGNKRIACVSLMAFLSLNGKWLKTDWQELYDIAVTVANSQTKNRSGILKLLNEFVRNTTVEK